ncbi:MAG: hypothetical protein DLM69_04600, partial [Candidatus Chloroheliales bacterium]
QILIEEIRERLGSAARPCAATECIRHAYELDSYLPQLEGDRLTVARNYVERVRGTLKLMPAASSEACLTHLLLGELRHYALLVLQIEHLRNREFADLLHSRDALHFMLAYQHELELDVAAEEALLAKWDARLKQGYDRRFDATLQHYQGLMPLDEARWWWYLDREEGGRSFPSHREG